MPSIFITGANRGLGLEFAKLYAAAGWRVLAGVRDPAKAEALEPHAAKIVPLEVTDQASIDALPAALAGERIDVLLNNAGIFGTIVGDSKQAMGTVETETWERVLRTNLIAPLRVTNALLPLLGERTAEAPGIVGILSSEMSSITNTTLPGSIAYRTSKAAVNMLGKLMSIELKGRNIAVVLLHPGWASTELGTARAPVKPADSVAGVKRQLDQVTLADAGRFLSFDGRAMQW